MVERSRSAGEFWEEEYADPANRSRGFHRGSILGGAEVARAAAAAMAMPMRAMAMAMPPPPPMAPGAGMPRMPMKAMAAARRSVGGADTRPLAAAELVRQVMKEEMAKLDESEEANELAYDEDDAGGPSGEADDKFV